MKTLFLILALISFYFANAQTKTDPYMAMITKGYKYLYEKGNGQEAISEFTKAINKSPKRCEGYYYRANARRIFFGLADDALRDINTAIDINPSLYLLYSERSECYKRKQDYEKAHNDLRMAMALCDDPCIDISLAILDEKIKATEYSKAENPFWYNIYTDYHKL
jgi:tetratricopeptide (TPR) repeat protein